MASILIVFSTTPHGNATAKDSLDFAMAATAYGHQVSGLFIDDGVFQLLNVAPEQTFYQTKQPVKIVQALRFYDIENIYVCQQSVDKRKLNPKSISSEYSNVDAIEIRAIMQNHQFVINL
jgi:tRNA 2-thiouridine synthesizing protein C